MVSILSLVVFFFILVALYLAVTLILALAGWLSKKRVSRDYRSSEELIAAIDQRTDRLKTLFFNIAVALVLFAITPFVVLYFMLWR